MAIHNDLGKQGEELAVAWLRSNGFEVMHCNWKFSYYEIDIVAKRGKFLHFIEVKTRNDSRYGFPEDSVTKKKFKRLQRAADQYLFMYPGHAWISYDIMSITIQKDGTADYFFIEDVFM